MKTGLTAFRLGIPVFIVPFIMVYHPAMILEGSTLEIIRVAMTGLIGAGALAAGLEGYLLRQMTLIERGAALIGGLLLIMGDTRSEEHTSELQSLMRISYAVFCLKKKNTIKR